MRIGLKLATEQFPPGLLLGLGEAAEEVGLDTLALSDHFSPWRHTGGHAVAALPLLGALAARTSRIGLGTSVLTPTFRLNPAVVAQAFGTIGALAEGRVFLGVGTGEAMNELPATGVTWPSGGERRARLEEAIVLIRRLWTEERVSHEGDFYSTRLATVYDRPTAPVPILVAAGGPLAAALAGAHGDGLICTSGKDPALYPQLLGAMGAAAVAAGRDPATLSRTIEIKLSYDRDLGRARRACQPWAALALDGRAKRDVHDPLEMERLAAGVAREAHRRFIVTDSPQEAVERTLDYARLGFDHLVLHLPGDDQRQALELLAADVLPPLRQALSGWAGAGSPVNDPT